MFNHLEDINIKNTNASNKIASKYLKQKLKELQSDRSTIIMKDFNTSQ